MKNAADLAEITLPNADEDENYHLKNLNLDVKNLTSLDLSKQEKIKYLTVKNTKLSKLDLSTLGLLESVDVTENYNLKEVVLKNGKKGAETTLKTLVLSNNALETINLDHMTITTLNLDGNHIGALDLSKTTATKGNLGTQTFYVSEKTKNINLKPEIEFYYASKRFD